MDALPKTSPDHVFRYAFANAAPFSQRNTPPLPFKEERDTTIHFDSRMIESEPNVYSKRRVYSVTVKIAVVISQIIHL